MILRFKNREVTFPRRPLIMGIINVNDDSFCDDGSLEMEEVRQMVVRLIKDGADIVDVGAESARTNRKAITIEEEIARFEQFLALWQDITDQAKPRDEKQLWPPVLSINTWRSEVIEKVLPLGGDILNDMSALPTSINASLAAANDAALLLMHSVGEPKIPHTHIEWIDMMAQLKKFFSEKITLAQDVGLSTDTIILDPGIDFAKQKNENLEIYSRVDELKEFDCPLLLPVSRKTVIGDVLSLADAKERDAGTAACIVQGVSEGVNIFRVHNVSAAYDVIKISSELV